VHPQKAVNGTKVPVREVRAPADVAVHLVRKGDARSPIGVASCPNRPRPRRRPSSSVVFRRYTQTFAACTDDASEQRGETALAGKGSPNIGLPLLDCSFLAGRRRCSLEDELFLWKKVFAPGRLGA
jgi:hypothetical protein